MVNSSSHGKVSSARKSGKESGADGVLTGMPVFPEGPCIPRGPSDPFSPRGPVCPCGPRSPVCP